MAELGRKPLKIVLGVIAFLLIVYFVFGNSIIKAIAESKMTEAYGGEVNIGELDHTLFPTTVTMREIEVTNLGKPSHNQLKVGTASADVALMPLLSNQVIVNNLSLLEVQFDTPRQAPGEVLRAPSRALTFDEIKQQAKQAIPTTDELLARNPLKTTAAIEQAKATYEQYSETLKNDFEQLPDKAVIDDYRKQVDTLKESDLGNPAALLQAQNTFKSLKEKMRQDSSKLTEFTRRANEAKSAINNAIALIQTAKQQDMTLMRGLIAGDEAAMQQVTYFVFGDKAAEYTQYLTSALNVLVPMIQGSNKNEVPVTDSPSVLIKQADVSVLFGEDTLTSTWQNITDAHTTFGKPTTFTLEGIGKHFKQFTSNGQFWIDAEGVDASQAWNISGLSLDDVLLNQSDKLTATLTHALVQTAGSLTVENNMLTGKGDIDLSELAMLAEGSGKRGEAIANALKSLSKLSLSMLLDGQLSNPDFSLKSDLDNQLARYLVTELTGPQQQKLSEMQSKLTAMIETEQQPLNEQLNALNGMLGQSGANTNLLQELIDTQLSSLLKGDKKSLLDKLKNKLGQ